MSTVFDQNTHVNINQLRLPTGSNLTNETSSLACVEGCVAYDITSGNVCFSDGDHWYPMKYDTSPDVTLKVSQVPEPVLEPVHSVCSHCGH
jgi:hypothetical protein